MLALESRALTLPLLVAEEREASAMLCMVTDAASCV